jgi:hypothetical protein
MNQRDDYADQEPPSRLRVERVLELLAAALALTLIAFAYLWALVIGDDG